MTWFFYSLILFSTFSFPADSLAGKKNCPDPQILESSLEQLEALNSHPRFRPKKISFENNTFPTNYDALVYDLHPGDQIILPGGEQYTVKEVLGNGELTNVIEEEGGKVMRLPLKGEGEFNPRFHASMHAYLKMQKELKAAGISVIEVDHNLSRPPFVIFVKKENFLFKGDQYYKMLKSDNWENIPQKTIKKAKKEFLKFMEQTWRYVDIGDFGLRQMGFDGEKWILFDFDLYASPAHLPLRNFDQKENTARTRIYRNSSVGSYKYQMLPEKMEHSIYKSINKIRKKMKNKHAWFERSSEVATGHLDFIPKITPLPLEVGHTVRFDLTDFYFKKLAKGQIPKGNNLEIKIIGEGIKKDNIMTYPVLLNNKDKAEIKIVIKENKIESKEIINLAENEGKNKTYLKGDDFILFY